LLLTEQPLALLHGDGSVSYFKLQLICTSSHVVVMWLAAVWVLC